MTTILIAKSSRGCLNRQELAKYIVQTGTPAIVIFNCRIPTCLNSWIMNLETYKLIDIHRNPIRCPICDNHDVNASWCNFTERPKTYIGEECTESIVHHPATYFPDGSIHTEEWTETVLTPETSYKSDYNTALSQMDAWQSIHGVGSFPDWNVDYYKTIRETMWCLSVPNNEHINEVFHEILPLKNGSWVSTSDESVKYNHEFYRAIINIVIQTKTEGDIYELNISIYPPECDATTIPVIGRHFKNINESTFLLAINSANYTFTNWSGDTSSTASQISILMNNDKSIVANFVKNFTFTVLSQYGVVTKTPDLISYGPGSVVSLTVSETTYGYTFNNWSNVATSSGETATVVLDYDNKTVTANFNTNSYLLNIGVLPFNGGTTSPVVGEYVKLYNSSVTLIATNAPNFTFVNWTGDVLLTNPQISVVISANKSITANFTANYILTIISDHGTVTKNPNLVSYSPNTTVNLTAIADDNYDLISWENTTTNTSNSATVFMDGSKTIIANYSLEVRILIISVSPIGSGTTIPPIGNYIKSYGDVVSVSATNLPNYTFTNWTGDISSTDSQISITMTINKSIIAIFVANYILTIVSDHGTVTKNPNLTSYSPGTTVNLIAIADDTYDLIGWNGTSTNFGSSATVIMNSNKTVTASYSLESRTLSISISPVGSGTTIPAIGNYIRSYGDVINISATNLPNFTFINWTGDIVSVSPNIEITMTSSKAVTANFAVNFILNITSLGGIVTKTPDLVSYSPGTTVNLSVEMNQGCEFGSWDNITTESGATATVLMDSDKTVIVNYVVETKSLIISTLPVGVGDVSPAAGTYLKTYGSMASVTGSDTLFGVVPNYTFLKWTGDIISTASTLDLTMTRNYSLVANFKTNDDGTSFNGDFIIITYNFTSAGGSDLDTKTQMIAPRTGNTVGYNVSNSDSQYIYWGGDNQGYGAESVYIDVKYTLLGFPALTNIDVKLKCYWSGVKLSGQMTIDIVAYKGGIMSLLPNPEYRFINTGGRVVAALHYPFTVNSTSFNTPTTLGTLRYNMETKSLIWMA